MQKFLHHMYHNTYGKYGIVTEPAEILNLDGICYPNNQSDQQL